MKTACVRSTLKRTTLLGVLLLSPLFARAQAADSPAISELLQESKDHAVLARSDAETLESYTRTMASWQSHATLFIHMKEHANDLIRDFNKLSSMRDEASPWQREAIDHVTPLLQDMSDHLSATIKHFNENKNRVQLPPYPEYAKANRELMDKTSRLISDFVDYGEAKAKTDALEKTMTLPVMAQEHE